MQNIKQSLINFWNDEEGLTTVEYAIAGGVIAAGVIGAFTTLGTTVDTAIDAINTQFTTAAAAG